MPAQSVKRPILLETAGLILILALAAAIRLSPWQKAHLDGRWFFSDGDSYYHLRRIGQTVEKGGRVPMFDPYLAYPRGQRIQWHGGYDLPVAGAVAVVCGSRPGRDCLETVAALSTPLLGVIATLLVFLLGRAAAGRAHRLVAAALFAVYPFSAGSAALGHVDHHALEPMCVAAVLWALARDRPVLAGALAGIAFSVFPSALLPFGVVAAALMADRSWRLRRGARGDGAAIRFTATAFVVLIPIVASGAFADSWEPSAASRFHLASVAAWAVAAAGLELAVKLLRGRRSLAFLALAAIAVAAGIVAGWESLSPLYRFGFGKASDLWIGVRQQQPVASGPLVFALGMAVASACCWTALTAWRRDLRGLALAGMTALPLTLFGLWQMRFLMMASPALVLVIAHVLIEARHFVVNRLATLSRRARFLAYANYMALALLALVPVQEYGRIEPQPRYLQAGTRLLGRFGRTRPRKAVASVLSDWTWGHHILYFTGLPTVASPFIFSGLDPENVEARRALLGERPESIYEAMRIHRSRYLLLSDSFDPGQAAASINRPRPRAPAAVQLMAGEIDGWSRLRLVDLEPGVRLFELVPGARLTGRCAPDRVVAATLELRTGNGKTIRLRYRTMSSGDGVFELRVPQPTGTYSESLSAIGSYSIGGCEALVTEKQVAEGLAARVSCPLR